MVGYYQDGPNVVTLAMNGWGEAEPAWWLNLQVRPETTVDLPDGARRVRARAATGDERERLWQTFRDYPGVGRRHRWLGSAALATDSGGRSRTLAGIERLVMRVPRA